MEFAGTWGRGAPALGPGRLQVWWTPLDLATTCSPEGAARNRGCITPAEAAEVGGSKSPEVAAKRTAARALARTVLARAVGDALAEAQAGAGSSAAGWGSHKNVCTGVGHIAGNGAPTLDRSHHANGSAAAVSPQDLRFARNSHGKPHLVAGGPDWPVLRHNLTHTHDLAGVAVLRQPECSPADAASSPSNGSPSTSACAGGGGGGGGGGRVVMSVGLDVERLDRAPRDPMALARRRLASAEVRDLEAIADPKQRARHFMWLWTLKEAYVKARGTGINAPPGLKGFAIGFRDMSADQHQAVEAAVGSSHGVSHRLTSITITHTGSIASAKNSLASAQVPARATAHAAVAVEHSTTAAAQSDAGALPAMPAALQAPAQTQTQPLPDADVGPDAQFHFLLFQPTPAHVGALCIATQQQQQQQQQDQHPHDVHAGNPSSSWGSGDNGSSSSSSGNNGDGGASSVCSDGMSGGVSAHGSSSSGSSGISGSGTCWAAQVDHWWCVPLEAEAQLSPPQLTLLGCTWGSAADTGAVQPT
ncbi:hypothetical protein HYH02_007945 [Chlamydomonas schloesseri]|uniref:holo-[acyl-carrier-protein] synthase n=1 Tax=Chlamydomonas schloesseri TaxID=2026947 RepID=A0A836B4P2_9CHLO|nr:hypothetical protein HYH02_007945 [Chlamydomonas schloesseri]|eukprot:KAG2447204.1 hypothetical protein HYH02_007945 [Chlamydomonas schloesseri]